ncbi:MAG: hypothetical protein MJ194_05085, partial [Clostridia bacterium]|nr:hypothetical protein [Clostridia bacterium]
APFGVELNLDVMGFSVLHKAGVKPDEEIFYALVSVFKVVEALFFLNTCLPEIRIIGLICPEDFLFSPRFKQKKGKKSH